MSKALMLMSGGQYAVTALAWAKRNYGETHAIMFDCNMLTNTEMAAVRGVCRELSVDLDVVSMRDVVPLRHKAWHLPLLLSHAHAIAAENVFHRIVVGKVTNAAGQELVDLDTYSMLMQALNDHYRPVDPHVQLFVPFIENRKDAYALAESMGVLDLVKQQSTSCAYDSTAMYDWGRGCNSCPKCVARSEAWRAFEGENQ